MADCDALVNEDLVPPDGCCEVCHRAGVDPEIGVELLQVQLQDGRGAEVCCGTYWELLLREKVVKIHLPRNLFSHQERTVDGDGADQP